MQTDDIDRLIARAVDDGHKRRHHRAGGGRRQWTGPARRALNTLFMLGFVAAIALYFLLPADRTAFFITGFTAMALKIAEFVIRFMF